MFVDYYYGDTKYDLPEKEAYLNTYLNGEYYNSLTDKDIVISHIFNIGEIVGSVSNDNNGVTFAENHERESREKWYGKIALATLTEYAQSSTNSSCVSLKTYYENCSPFNWLDKIYSNADGESWLLTRAHATGFQWFSYGGDYLNYISGYGSPCADVAKNVMPALYLSSDISLTGNGTELSPYTIIKSN